MKPLVDLIWFFIMIFALAHYVSEGEFFKALVFFGILQIYSLIYLK